MLPVSIRLGAYLGVLPRGANNGVSYELQIPTQDVLVFVGKVASSALAGLDTGSEPNPNIRLDFPLTFPPLQPANIDPGTTANLMFSSLSHHSIPASYTYVGS